jgi:hypothetical protein
MQRPHGMSFFLRSSHHTGECVRVRVRVCVRVCVCARVRVCVCVCLGAEPPKDFF